MLPFLIWRSASRGCKASNQLITMLGAATSGRRRSQTGVGETPGFKLQPCRNRRQKPPSSSPCCFSELSDCGYSVHRRIEAEFPVQSRTRCWEDGRWGITYLVGSNHSALIIGEFGKERGKRWRRTQIKPRGGGTIFGGAMDEPDTSNRRSASSARRVGTGRMAGRNSHAEIPIAKSAKYMIILILTCA